MQSAMCSVIYDPLLIKDEISMFQVGVNEAVPSSTFHYIWPEWKRIEIFVSCNAGRELLLIFHKPFRPNTKLLRICIRLFAIFQTYWLNHYYYLAYQGFVPADAKCNHNRLICQTRCQSATREEE